MCLYDPYGGKHVTKYLNQVFIGQNVEINVDEKGN